MILRIMQSVFFMVGSSYLLAMAEEGSLIVKPYEVVCFHCADRTYRLPERWLKKAQSEVLNELLAKATTTDGKLVLAAAPNVVDVMVYFLANDRLPKDCDPQDAIKALEIFQIPALKEYMLDHLIVEWVAEQWKETIFSKCKVCKASAADPSERDKLPYYEKRGDVVHHLITEHGAKIVESSQIKDGSNFSYSVNYLLPVYYRTYAEKEAAAQAEQERTEKKNHRKKKKRTKKTDQAL